MKISPNQNPKVRKEEAKRSEMRKYLRQGDMAKIARAAMWFKGQINKSAAEPYIEIFVKSRKEEVERTMQATTASTSHQAVINNASI